MTGGRGDYTMDFLRYEEVPSHLTRRRSRGERGGLTGGDDRLGMSVA